MTTTTVTIAGKTVGLMYCIGTEIAFEDLAGTSDRQLSGVIVETIRRSANGQEPSVGDAVRIILAAHLAYNQANGIDTPSIIDKDLLENATKDEIATALKEVIELWMKFYKIGKGDKIKEPAKKGGRKRKN